MIVDVVVVGGGITGLAAAYGAHRSGRSVVLFEASDRVGGKIASAEVAGGSVDVGPDAFLARVPWAVELCHDLGMAEDLVEPATGQAWLWSRGRLRALPDGLVLGVPSRLGPLARSGVVSWRGVARAALGGLIPHRPPESADPSVAEAIGRHVGAEVVERLVDPLLGGINAGDSNRLSLAAAAPTLVDATRAPKLMRALRAQRTAAASGPVFLAPRDGMTALVGRLQGALPDGTVRVGHVVDSLSQVGGPDGPVWCVSLASWASAAAGDSVQPGVASRFADARDRSAIAARRVVLATPAWVSAELVRPFAAAAADELDRIAYSSVALTVLAYPRAGAKLPPGSGMLVPRSEGRLMTAASWYDQKWPRHARPDHLLVRASAGRLGDERVTALSDAEVIARVDAELQEAVPEITVAPEDAVVTRWPRAFPQYEPGHGARVERIMAAMPAGVTVTGAAYRGVGMAACIREGLAAGRG